MFMSNRFRHLAGLTAAAVFVLSGCTAAPMDVQESSGVQESIDVQESSGDARRDASDLRMAGNIVAERGLWKPAVTLFQYALRHEVENTAAQRLAVLYAWAGDRNRHNAHCRRMFERFGEVDNPITADRLAKSYLLLPPAEGTTLSMRAVELARFAGEHAPGHRFEPWFRLVHGLAEYRLRQYDRAVPLLQAARLAENRACRSAAMLVQAMAEHQRGNPEEARQLLEEASVMIDALPDPQDDNLGGSWPDILTSQMIRREARALIE